MIPEPKRLLLLATTTGYQARVFAEAAERLGLEVVLATDRCKGLDDPWQDRSIPVQFHDPFAHLEKLEAAARQRPFAAIVALGDRPTFLAALAAERLGIPFHPPAAVEACNNKYLARERYRAAGLLVPDYFRIALGEDPAKAARRALFPCVLKPLGLSGSRGVIRADTPSEFIAAFERIRALLDSREFLAQPSEQNRWVQVESFIPGREFAIEALVTGGRLDVLAVFDKLDPLDGPFFGKTIYVTPVPPEPRSTARADPRDPARGAGAGSDAWAAARRGAAQPAGRLDPRGRRPPHRRPVRPGPAL
jgi:biotin carboxylase